MKKYSFFCYLIWCTSKSKITYFTYHRCMFSELFVIIIFQQCISESQKLQSAAFSTSRLIFFSYRGLSQVGMPVSWITAVARSSVCPHLKTHAHVPALLATTCAVTGSPVKVGCCLGPCPYVLWGCHVFFFFTSIRNSCCLWISCLFCYVEGAQRKLYDVRLTSI